MPIRVLQRFFLLAVFAALAACGGGQGASPAGAVPAPVASRAGFLGVNTPFLFFDGAAQARQIAQLRSAGARWVRIDLHWDRIEPEQGRFELAEMDAMMARVRDAGLDAVVYLVGSPAFARAAGTTSDAEPPLSPALYAQRLTLLAHRYPWIKHWQIWNEPNLPAFWRGDAVAYAGLVRAVREAFDADPALSDRKLVLGGMAYYSQLPGTSELMLAQLQRLGVFAWVDVVAYHPYSNLPTGDDDPADPDNFLPRATRLNRLLRDAGVKEIWATEFGWSTYAGPVEQQPLISPETQADYLARRLPLMQEAGFDRVFWFALSDLDARVSPRDQAYGLLRLDGSAKPAWTVFARWLNGQGG